MLMVRTWLAIATAEFQVLTSGLRRNRKLYTAILYTLALVWAVVITPMIYNAVLGAIFPMHILRPMLMVMFPGLMRTLGLFLFLVLLLFPLSYALQEIKIGQWEIFLSNNVRTRDIMTGTFLGKIGLYGLITVALAPLLITPFMLAFEVSIIGQLLVYGTVTMLAMGTIWLSNFVTSLVQARLGDSSRGNDIAKALAMVVAIVVIIPMYGLMFFLPTLSEMMGLNAFLILPSTWFADLISWLAITFNGIGLTGSQIMGFSAVLQIDLLMTSVLAIGFVLGTVGLALGMADRVFTIEAGVRTEVVTTVGKENIILRGVRRINSGPFGSLMVTNFKDFLRKAQNLSKIGYGLIIAIIMPILMMSIDLGGETIQFSDMFLTVIAMMSLIGSMPFAGTGFLESKDQLWIIQGAPSGGSRFVKSRIASQALICVPLAVIPSAVIYFIMETTVIEFVLLLGLGYIAVVGGMLVATGVTARNPNYEDTKSPAHQANVMTSVMLAEFSIIGVMMVDIFLAIGLNIDFFGILRSIFGNAMVGITVTGLIVQWTLAGLLVWSGIKYLSRPES
jgi:hypothetical protein